MLEPLFNLIRVLSEYLDAISSEIDGRRRQIMWSAKSMAMIAYRSCRFSRHSMEYLVLHNDVFPRGPLRLPLKEDQ